MIASVVSFAHRLANTVELFLALSVLTMKDSKVPAGLGAEHLQVFLLEPLNVVGLFEVILYKDFSFFVVGHFIDTLSCISSPEVRFVVSVNTEDVVSLGINRLHVNSCR